MSEIIPFLEVWFLVFFYFFRKNYLLLSCATSVRPSAEIISFRSILISNKPIDLKMSMNVRKGVVHVRKACFFKSRIASCNLCCNSCKLQKILPYFPTITVRVYHNFNLWPNVLCTLNNKSRPL